jgi:hypothetical protein
MADTRYELIALNDAFESGFTNALGNDYVEVSDDIVYFGSTRRGTLGQHSIICPPV